LRPGSERWSIRHRHQSIAEETFNTCSWKKITEDFSGPSPAVIFLTFLPAFYRGNGDSRRAFPADLDSASKREVVVKLSEADLWRISKQIEGIAKTGRRCTFSNGIRSLELVFSSDF
jgi:hypothetical protein